jgi:hypothetical protein
MEIRNSENLSHLLNEAVLPKFKNLTAQEIFNSCNPKQFLDFFRTVCVKAIEKFWGNIEDFEFKVMKIYEKKEKEIDNSFLEKIIKIWEGIL